MSRLDSLAMSASSLLLIQLAVASSGAAAGAGVDEFRVKMEKWVETRQIISEETAEWKVDRQSLRATRDLLRDEKEALEAEIQELDEASTAADDERRDLLLGRGEYRRAIRALELRVAEMEGLIDGLARRLPEPLHRKLEPLLVQIPDDPEQTRVPIGQRLMNVLGVLAQAEKWNGTATLVGETRPVPSGKQVQVRTLYWGLGQAVYVDAMGETAGIGKPAPNGWEFSNDPSLVDEARLLLDIYEGNVDVIDFVDIPVSIE